MPSLFTFYCVDHNIDNSSRDGNTRHLTCLPGNLYAGEEANIRTEYGRMDWFLIGKGVRQGCILSLCLCNLYAEYTLQNAGLDEAQAGIKTVRRNINNLGYHPYDICDICDIYMNHILIQHQSFQ